MRDADWLEALGARGVARACAFAGAFGKPLGVVEWDPAYPPQLQMNTSAADPSVMHHFFSKLLWMEGKLLTKTARELAVSRHQFMVAFLNAYGEETGILAKVAKTAGVYGDGNHAALDPSRSCV